MLTVTINNEPLELADASVLAEALALWPALPEQYAVAVNGQFVPRHLYAEHRLKTGDRLDVVVPVSGG
ncbi:sulfur carrier protein ThiS [Simiduia sp. 21SJ11W-1]|uniref:sulfur carrier protein ThiS n=1 Tax=Simiduia sp. 21SJ11W-1 TaxID=2909669 RepID=UPI00209C7CD5|nr:sulfur carrier protein ThiS [Simiduia sp. 21SJ11W-1]UTA49018.1 sulfur carrier protein ThiS [Simiduia sp. 21SJ11W-1]